ncbi:DUF2235 domain-containing protein [Sphingomonas sp. LY54]|uniref:DUF2235 domain-containing protein n=1 Tax=Sphingomonas sp. LY54 TaxID=3095343 RepID=UPI002D76A9EA|nr:DUF2235 domain-containing protein [Sphingomonas sp. LY54]WRP29770.1 DUF2235 domain-containing protein [Sphingomonas sp. LY54]
MNDSDASSALQISPNRDSSDQPKSLILFSDGTGNSSAKLFKTNVWRMYEAVDLGPSSPGKRKQIAFYDNGVGTSALMPLALLGGVFGFGLKRNILDIYRYACRNYKPGDDIYGFGFSRGAFTIRLVIALIASQGLVSVVGERELRLRSMDAYRAFRRDFLPRRLHIPTRILRLISSALRGAWRRACGIAPYDQQSNREALISFLGVWDTVAAYGGPIVEITRGIDNWIYALSMSDYCLDSRVRRARHALAIDDERDAFHPLLWDEVHEARLVSQDEVREGRLTQVWFTGMHADVGGGYPDESLSYVSFLWMLTEAQNAGLRTLNTVTDRFRALANSAGPIHDSRSGIGAYYRYQPRNIGAWLHPADGESIVHDPDLSDPKGNPQGLLTSINVHESVIARISSGTDGYAPFTLPAQVKIVPPLAGGETALQSDSETPNVRPAEEQRPLPMVSPAMRERIEHPEAGERRVDAMAAVWDLVWQRRVYYFATLLLTIALVTMPVWVAAAPEPPVLADGRTWIGGLIRILAVATPEFVDPLIDAMANNSFYFLLIVLAICLLVWRGKATELRLRDKSRAIWRQSIDGSHPESSRPSLLQKLRTNPLYRRPLRFLKWKFFPTLTAALIVVLLTWLIAGAYAQLRLAGLERDHSFCSRSGADEALTMRQLDFSPASACQSVGATVRKGSKYIVDLEVVEPWRDGRVRADPRGLPAGRLGLGGYAGVPFRRVITANYLQPLVGIRSASGAIGGRDRVHIEALNFRQQGDNPTTWRAEFEAGRSGELTIFANEAVLPFRPGARNNQYFYRSSDYGNHGTACVTIRRADRAGEMPLAPENGACAAAETRKADVSSAARAEAILSSTPVPAAANIAPAAAIGNGDAGAPLAH